MPLAIGESYIFLPGTQQRRIDLPHRGFLAARRAALALSYTAAVRHFAITVHGVLAAHFTPAAAVKTAGAFEFMRRWVWFVWNSA